MAILTQSQYAGDQRTKEPAFSDGTVNDVIAKCFFENLFGTDAVSVKGTLGGSAISYKSRNGKIYKVENAWHGTQDYFTTDLIASAKAAGYTDKQISNALNNAYKNTDYQVSILDPNSETLIGNVVGPANKNTAMWDANTVKQYNISFSPTTRALQNYINKVYPNSGAYVTVLANENGTDYSVYIEYTDPYTTRPVRKLVSGLSVNSDKIPSAYEISDALSASGIDIVLNNSANVPKNAQADWDMADAVLKKLNSVTYANSSNTLTAADRAAITAALPNTDNLTAWNASKDANIFNTLIKNLNNNNPEVLERLSLEQLEDIANVVSGEQQKITERNINNKQTQLLQDIAKDPNPYSLLVQQQRVDNAAGTIAGQRAANAQAIASEADAEYDSQAAELYKSLFSGDNGNVAQGTYNDIYSANVAASDQSIQGKIDAIFDAAQKEAISMQELSTLLNAVGAAVGVDVSRYADEIAENQAAAGGKATELLKRIESDVNTQIAAGQASINTIKNLWQEQSSYSSQAKDGSANIQAPSDALKDYLNTLNLPSGGGYTKVSAGDYKKAERFENQHYDDVVNEEFLNWILSDETIDSFTKAKTIKEFLGQDLADTLTVEGLKKLYEGYNTEATEQSNKVFNQAQRAYIAAITAGDVKTADQLARLATSASTSKGNLFAASALANQFKQQSGLSANGRQLATDFLNQQSFNRTNQAKQATAADAALGKYYYGTGSGDPNQKTVSGAYNIHAQNKATGYDGYGKLGNMLMGYNQDMSSYNVKNSIDNYDRLAQIAAGITGINATAASANKGIQGDKDYLTGAAAAKKAMAEQINPNLKK